MKKVIIIGGGAAGQMAAVSAAESGAQVTILEKMNLCGKKILITGKGRCNITNTADIPTFIKNMPGNGSFLYKAINVFYNNDIISFLENWGVPVKFERGGRIFPVSDQAADVIKAFNKTLTELKVKVFTDQRVRHLIVADNQIAGVQTDTESHFCDAVILSTGGASYPATGSSGDGYAMAKEAGHNIIPLKPSIVPIEVTEEWISDLQGLSLRNVLASVFYKGKKIADEFGELLFTHYGLSGPIILSLSRVVSELYSQNNKNKITITINLKPALSRKVLDKRLQKDFTEFTRKMYKNSLNDLLPSKLINVIIDLSYIDPDKPVNQITKAERLRLLDLLQNMMFTVSGLRPLSEAIVTAGGVNIKEINPSTMESKLVKNLFLAGEVIDIDGYTGGFNLQAAFSTGFLAGLNAAKDK